MAYWDAAFNCYGEVLKPGEIATAQGERLLTTLLGSCVAVVLYDEVAKCIGMNHIVLPKLRETIERDNGINSAVNLGYETATGRYGNVAMERLINGMMKSGANRSRLVAKVFGGASVTAGKINIGEQNSKFAISYLQTEGIPIVAQSVGGLVGIKVFAFGKDGSVYLQRLENKQTGVIIQEELSVENQLKQKDLVGSIELFD